MLQDSRSHPMPPAHPEPAGKEAPGRLERASLAHQFGNLIQVATSATNILARNLTAQANADMDRAIVVARRSLDRAGLLVRQTLREALSYDGEPVRVDVAIALRDVELTALSTLPRGTSMRLSLHPKLANVVCDPIALSNAVLNLAFNARDAMPDGGEILIAAEPAVSAEGVRIVAISVSDTGIGMSADTASRACEPFFTTKGDGLGGLGLVTVKRFVQDLSGSLEIESTPGAGTRVTMRLPAAP